MKSKYLRYFFSILFTTGMVAAAALADNKEIIFPEVLALLLGAWVAVSMPWRVNRIQFIVIMPLVAVSGVVLVRYLRLPSMDPFGPETVWMRMIAAYLVVAVLLLVSRSTLLPAVSAGILPVLMGTETWIYPLSVAIMAVLIMAGQLVMERFHIWGAAAADAVKPQADGIREKTPEPVYDHTRLCLQWLGGLPFMMILSGAALFSGFRFFAAPPLVVALVTFTMKNSPSGKQAVKSWFMLFGCSVIGAGCRWLLCEQMDLSFIVCAFAATALVLLFVDFSGIVFPPAGALAILPILIPESMLPTYPLQIAAGAAFCVIAGKLVSVLIDRIRKPAADTGQE